jgi:hypothetical protein
MHRTNDASHPTEVPLNQIATFEIPFKNEHLGYGVKKPINWVQM